MLDDTRGDAASPGSFRVSGEIDAILKHSVHRPQAERWARNLRFLTFDDSVPDLENENCGSNPPETRRRQQCSRCKQRIAPSAGHTCVSHGFFHYKRNEWEKQLKEYSDPCVHVESQTCADCQHIPVFPSGGRVTRFRIRRLRPKDVEPNNLSRCAHFLAVSYCWSSQGSEDGVDNEPYIVVEEDGTTRPMRTQRVTIDRVVDYAVQNGYRMIWIDQECIQQEDPKEKELGVQAMDIVYLRANMSVGLCQAVLQQKHLDALLLYFEVQVGTSLHRRGPRPLRSCHTLRLEHLAEALQRVAADPWNTRAWILQEAFASSGNMTLLFPKSEGVNVSGWSLVCHDMSLTEIAVKLDILQRCLKISIACVQPLLREKITRGESHWRKTLDQLKWFHPERPEHFMNFWIGDSKPRRTCSAAVALSFLKIRENSRVVDRVAIVANLCGYDQRLSTTELEGSQSRLGICILALSMKNGDFSLLVPELYQGLQCFSPHQSNGVNDFSWAMPWMKRLHYIEAEPLRPAGPTAGVTAAVSHFISDKGLSLPGFLWRVDKFVSLAPIKDKYAEPWSRLTRPKNDRELKCSGKQLGRTASSITSGITRRRWLATTQILFEILMLLRELNQTEMADAILNSVSDFKWRNRDGRECVESVDEIPEHVRLENRRGMFQLDAGPDGKFRQEWLIDRVLDQGGLWLGRSISSLVDELGPVARAWMVKNTSSDSALEGRRSDDSSGSSPPARLSRVTKAGVLDSRSCGPDNDTLRLTEPGSGHISALHPVAASATAPTSPDQRHELKTKKHSETMFLNSMMMKLIDAIFLWNDHEIPEMEGSEQTLESFMLGRPSALSNFMMVLNQPYSPRAHFALFDIDGSASGEVFVLTPYQQVLESIPRPDVRSLSVSWIVEPVGEEISDEVNEMDDLRRGSHESKFRAKGMVRGMWKYTIEPLGRFALV